MNSIAISRWPLAVNKKDKTLASNGQTAYRYQLTANSLKPEVEL